MPAAFRAARSPGLTGAANCTTMWVLDLSASAMARAVIRSSGVAKALNLASPDRNLTPWAKDCGTPAERRSAAARVRPVNIFEVIEGSRWSTSLRATEGGTGPVRGEYHKCSPLLTERDATGPSTARIRFGREARGFPPRCGPPCGGRYTP